MDCAREEVFINKRLSCALTNGTNEEELFFLIGLLLGRCYKKKRNLKIIETKFVRAGHVEVMLYNITFSNFTPFAHDFDKKKTKKMSFVYSGVIPIM